MDQLRIATAGSVDDGKSSLIGRLLYDVKAVYDDQLESIRRASLSKGVDELQLSYLTDGLRAEREQNITIDVAYRYFSTPNRKFIIADTPGHFEFTRNMVTGSSTADVSIILVDAFRGLTPQSKRHAAVAALLGVQSVIFAVNKMDLLNFSEIRFREIYAQLELIAEKLNFTNWIAIPISALHGDNVVDRSKNTGWYNGPSLLEVLETIDISSPAEHFPARLPVQAVLEHEGQSLIIGQLESGQIAIGDQVEALPGEKQAKIVALYVQGQEATKATAGEPVAIKLEPSTKLKRGDLVSKVKQSPVATTQLRATLCWLGDKPLQLKQSYPLIHTTKTVNAEVVEIVHLIDVENLDPVSSDHVKTNEIADVWINLDAEIFPDLYDELHATGSFILVDPETKATCAAGMIRQCRASMPELKRAN